MDIFTVIADFLNRIFSFGLFGGSGASTQAPQETPHHDDPNYDSGGSIGGQNAPETPPQPTGTHHSLVTVPEHIGSRFYDTNSPAWRNQVGTDEHGQTLHGAHLGTDYLAPAGSAVYAPYDFRVIAVGRYSDEGRMGGYVIGTMDNGIQYYSGHLDNVSVSSGDTVKAGTQIGVTNVYAHTHIQMKKGEIYLNPEEYLK